MIDASYAYVYLMIRIFQRYRAITRASIIHEKKLSFKKYVTLIHRKRLMEWLHTIKRYTEKKGFEPLHRY